MLTIHSRFQSLLSTLNLLVIIPNIIFFITSFDQGYPPITLIFFLFSLNGFSILWRFHMNRTLLFLIFTLQLLLGSFILYLVGEELLFPTTPPLDEGYHTELMPISFIISGLLLVLFFFNIKTLLLIIKQKTK